MRKHECPRCGRMTEGSYSEGGLKWAICVTCMTADQDTAYQERKDQEYQEDREARQTQAAKGE